MKILKITIVDKIKVVLFKHHYKKQYYTSWFSFNTNEIPLINNIYFPKELNHRIDTPHERKAMTFNQAQKHFTKLVELIPTMKFE